MSNEDIQAHTGEEPAEPKIKYKSGTNKLDEFNWLESLPYDPRNNEVIEVRFKNTRKGFYRNVNDLRLEVGDLSLIHI